MIVKYIPTEYRSDDGQIWLCQHVKRTAELYEFYDELQANVTGEPQIGYLEYLEVCDECGDAERVYNEQ